MRIATNTIYNLSVSSINRQQADLLKTQQQISANRRVLTASDDPVAASRVLEISQADAINTQYGVNAQTASGRLAQTESTLGRIGDLLQAVRQNAVTAGNGSFTASDRASVAQDVQAMYDELLSVANSTDGEGNYLFSGFQTDVTPFAPSAAGVQYLGDDGQRLVQVASGRQIAVSESGADVFMRVRASNGTFTVSAPPANTGSAVYTQGTVTDPTAITGHQYQIVFTVTGTGTTAVTTYDVNDVTAGTTVATAQPYTSGGAIAFDGMSLQVQGAPASGDVVQIDPSKDQDIFKTISKLVTALQGAADDPASNARLQNSLNDAIANLDQALDSVNSVRAGVGTRMRETDDLQSSSDDLSVQYKQNISNLQDLDYAKAVSDLVQQQNNLQAAQKTFLQTAQLSIFNFL
ncbi:MAG TPA: flagellar hook-associated protein FlgL [Burkholderiales bacterium]|nr:flagellar hook-associated protein FlgL [Burkholderiales bacterium]